MKKKTIIIIVRINYVPTRFRRVRIFRRHLVKRKVIIMYTENPQKSASAGHGACKVVANITTKTSSSTKVGTSLRNSMSTTFDALVTPRSIARSTTPDFLVKCQFKLSCCTCANDCKPNKDKNGDDEFKQVIFVETRHCTSLSTYRFSEFHIGDFFDAQVDDSL